MRSGLCTGHWTPNSSNHVFMDFALCTLTLPLTGTKQPSSIPEKQPQTIIPPLPNFTVVTVHSSRQRSPGIHKTQISPSGCQAVKCDSSPQRAFPLLQSPVALHHSTCHLVLRIVILCAAAWLWKSHTVLVLMLLPVAVWNSVVRQLLPNTFEWSTALRLSCRS